MAAAINTGTIIDRVAEELGDDLYARPSPRWSGVIYAVAGFSIAVGAMVISAPDFDSNSRIGPLIAAVLLVAISYILLFTVVEDRPDLRPGLIAMLSVGLAGTSLLLLPIDTGGAAIRGLIMAVLFGAAWFVPHSRGRPWLLGLALVGLWVAMVDSVESGATTNDIGLGPGVASDGVGMASLIFGLLCLGMMRVLDKRGLVGSMSTPFAAVGTAAFVVGISAVVGDITSAAGAGTLVLLGGALLVWLGARGGHRRFTAWLGGIGVFVGLASYVGEIYDGDSFRMVGVWLAVLGLVLGAIAFFLADHLDGTADGDDEPATPTPTTVVEAVDPGTQPPAGWYTDPSAPDQQRYWDGGSWTDHTNGGG